ncbi:tricarballylate utilization 4Fe-4S protein TcuB [Sphingomonas sp. SUN039]|uniref:tricarballylate utilization 4Fe-4S protein TcuB n=1 Tax=Sphingomonas sp. SUN039 TaxID=2937787 RepID=UPI0021641D32|nr:tricarballylate utilization 4Fe-4S protein TcuB [Sphingomonas sp. SUN039]UVO54574.1 tricarballylate utilization 4Fe-4S protein TcuB [Sphingomonas sp. SUN039]
MHGPDLVALTGSKGEAALAEARRALQICNACRYCEGYCAVFPAMTLRREFADADLIHLANLCHGCRDCLYACQYAPPHEFGINIPKTMSEVRIESYARAAPGTRLLVDRPQLATALLLGMMVALVELYRRLLGGDPGGRGFYAVMGREAMIAFGLTAAGFALTGLTIGLLRYRAFAGPADHFGPSLRSWWRAAGDAATLRYLGGGGVGCNDTGESFSYKRRLYHHLMAWGFAACFAATSLGAIYDHLLHWPAPYPWISVPGLLGTVGGIAMIAGTTGLIWLKRIEGDSVSSPTTRAFDRSLLILLLIAAATGLANRLAHGTATLTPALIMHLASIGALLVAMPLGKFMHAGFRFLALARHADERRRLRID